jgi:hypothetical protein
MSVDSEAAQSLPLRPAITVLPFSVSAIVPCKNSLGLVYLQLRPFFVRAGFVVHVNPLVALAATSSWLLAWVEGPVRICS